MRFTRKDTIICDPLPANQIAFSMSSTRMRDMRIRGTRMMGIRKKGYEDGYPLRPTRMPLCTRYSRTPPGSEQ